MTLRDLRAKHPELFYEQDWFDGEEFMDTHLPYPLPGIPTSVEFVGAYGDFGFQPTTALLAGLYVGNPTDEIWKRYLWTCDFDSQGQRVYVGDNGKGLEIHRHLHLTDRWGVPCWEEE